MELAKKFEEAMLKVEPEFIERAKSFLTKPLLVFRERNFILFDGKENNSKRIHYSKCCYFNNPSRPEENIDFFDSVAEGNNIILEDNELTINKDGNKIQSIKKLPEWFILGFQ